MRVLYTPNVKQYKLIGHGVSAFDVVFRAPNRRHTGRGFGAIGSFLGRTVLPFLKNIILPTAKKVVKKHILPSAKRALMGTVSDVIAGKNVKASLKKRALAAGENIFNDITSGSLGVSKRKRQHRKQKMGIRGRRRRFDIFT